MLCQSYSALYSSRGLLLLGGRWGATRYCYSGVTLGLVSLSVCRAFAVGSLARYSVKESVNTTLCPLQQFYVLLGSARPSFQSSYSLPFTANYDKAIILPLLLTQRLLGGRRQFPTIYGERYQAGPIRLPGSLLLFPIGQASPRLYQVGAAVVFTLEWFFPPTVAIFLFSSQISSKRIVAIP